MVFKLQGEKPCRLPRCVTSTWERNLKSQSKVHQFTMAGFFGWEFRAQYHATDDEEKPKLASKITEGLTGEPLKVAIFPGLTELNKKEGVLFLAKALREHIFPLGGAEARELFKAGQRPGSAVNPRSATSHAGGDGMTCFEIWTRQSS